MVWASARLLRCWLVGAGAVSAACALASTSPKRPNVLFMLVDDMGYNDVEYHNGGIGPGWTKTPNMNKLAARGVRLDHHCTCAVPPPR